MGAVDLLGIRPGVTAIIGGGGKTTLLRILGEALAREGRVLLCTSAKMRPFPDLPLARTAEELAALEDLRLVCAGRDVPGTGKLTALELPLAVLSEWFDYVLVEADGSAGRPLKAHASHEPPIPPEAAWTICVVGASGFQRPIREAAHRPERYAALAGVQETALATPETEAAVLRTEALQDIVYVNQVETPRAVEAAWALAARLDCPTVAGSLWKGAFFPCW